MLIIMDIAELALLTNKPRAASVVATGRDPVTCLMIDRNAFEMFLGPCISVLKRRADVYEQYADRL
eukprot:SAG31_NODE_384_length_16414_cov_7.492308_12_plen_66_part_00